MILNGFSVPSVVEFIAEELIDVGDDFDSLADDEENGDADQRYGEIYLLLLGHDLLWSLQKMCENELFYEYNNKEMYVVDINWIALTF